MHDQICSLKTFEVPIAVTFITSYSVSTFKPITTILQNDSNLKNQNTNLIACYFISLAF